MGDHNGDGDPIPELVNQLATTGDGDPLAWIIIAIVTVVVGLVVFFGVKTRTNR